MSWGNVFSDNRDAQAGQYGQQQREATGRPASIANGADGENNGCQCEDCGQFLQTGGIVPRKPPMLSPGEQE